MEQNKEEVLVEEEVIDYEKLPLDKLQEEYEEVLSDYEEWVGKQIESNMGWDDELLYIVGNSDDLHEIATELEKRGAKPDPSKLEAIDRKWKAWIKENRDPEYRFTFK